MFLHDLAMRKENGVNQERMKIAVQADVLHKLLKLVVAAMTIHMKFEYDFPHPSVGYMHMASTPPIDLHAVHYVQYCMVVYCGITVIGSYIGK